MADAFNRFNTGGQFYFPNQHSNNARNHLHRNGSPINNSRSLFQTNADTPSPNRSPGTNSPAHTPFGMHQYGNHRQNHNLLNGGAGHHNYQMNLHKGFQTQSGNHQSHQLGNQHADHTGIGGHNNYGNHQHNISAGALSNPTPHFTPAHLQNGTPDSNGSFNKPSNEHMAEHSREYHRLKLAGDKPHFYARTTPNVSRLPTAAPSSMAARLDVDEHGARPRAPEENEEMGTWDAMDLGGHGLKSMGPSIFRHYPHLRKIYFNHNHLVTLSPLISHMRFLTVLDISFNDLRELPPEIGMLTHLKKLLLFENHLQRLPYELGSLYQLEMLGLHGNPMREQQDLVERLVEHGTQDLIRYMREEAHPPTPPEEREWHEILNENEAPKENRFKVLSWNTLCDRAATQSAFGYAPTRSLTWSNRSDLILNEIRLRDADILALQEVDLESYHEFFAPNLATLDYKGAFTQKGRAQTMGEKEGKSVDGPSTFWKASKYILLDKHIINYSRVAIARPDMKGEHDVYNRVMPRDHVALVCFLENRQTGSRLIVANTHLTWEVWFRDVKCVQCGILTAELEKKADEWSRWPPTTNKDKEVYRFANEDGAEAKAKAEPVPSMSYETGLQIPMLVCGDFNSTSDSGVYDFITQGELAPNHEDLCGAKYGDFTRVGMSHKFNLKSSYGVIGELPFTNWTPDFRQVIDYVWFSTNTLQVSGVLGQIDPNYMSRVPGFPNHHFPSDHLSLCAEYAVKERKERKQVEADFGPSSRRS